MGKKTRKKKEQDHVLGLVVTGQIQVVPKLHNTYQKIIYTPAQAGTVMYANANLREVY